MTEDRERLIQAAEAAHQQEKERADRFRAFMCSHLGLSPGTPCEQAERILWTNSARDLSNDDLLIAAHFEIGLPPEYSFTQEQIEMAAEVYLAARRLTTSPPVQPEKSAQL
jgi:hypothetical protein